MINFITLEFLAAWESDPIMVGGCLFMLFLMFLYWLEGVIG